MGRLFGTDGIRGVAGKDLTAELAFRVGEAVGVLLAERDLERKILVGRDSRLSGPMLESALSAGLMSTGCTVHCVGIVPTPVVAFLTRYLGFPLGCVISASHNPIEDNGIKFFDMGGMKVADGIEDRIEELLQPGAFERGKVSGEEIGDRIFSSSVVDVYVKYLVSIGQDRLTGLKLVMDAAYGAGCSLGTSVFAILGAEVTPMNAQPDGSRINVDCGSTNPADCAARVVELQADMGVALDGDADRAIFIDEKGQIVDGDQVLAMWGLHLLKMDALPSKAIVGTVLSNKGLEVALEEHGGKLLRANVGDKYVLREMLESGARLGGEQSGHLIFLDYHTTGDGILTALMVAILMRETGMPLSRLARMMSRFPQVQLNIAVEDKQACLTDRDVQKAIEALTKEMDGIKGRLLVRPSGTESVIRVMTEAPDEAEARRLAIKAIDLFRNYSSTGRVTEI